jgi:hypothetical protein
LKRCSLAIAEEQALSFVQVAKDRRREQLKARCKRFAEPHHLVRLHCDHPDDPGHLRAAAFRLESILPTRIDAAHTFAEPLETLDELVGRREAALAVFLTLTAGLLVALVHGTPLAGARDVHALFDAELTATTGADAALSRRLFTIPLVPDAHSGTGSLAGIDVVARVPAADRLEDARAVATSGTGNAPIAICISGHALVAHEAILGRAAVHRGVAAPSVFDLMLPSNRIFDGIGVSVFAADEALERPNVPAAALTTTSHRHGDGA